MRMGALISVRDGIEMMINLLRTELHEAHFRIGDHADLDVGCLEVHLQRDLKARDGALDCLGLVRVRFHLERLLQLVRGLGFLRASGDRFEAVGGTRGFHTVELRPSLVIHGDEHGRGARGPAVRVLGVHLTLIRDLLSQVVHGDIITIVLLPVRRDFPRLEDDRSGVALHPRHASSNVLVDVIEARHVVLVHGLVGNLLGNHHRHAVLSANGHRGLTTSFRCLQGILYLVQSTLG
mmetsp:Transcript_20422/g.54708  ORF Transcript_20422/g.54708 Transcript_20422/m.54708 type:complete len:236 (-) Transcript_20422:99-806(-)